MYSDCVFVFCSSFGSKHNVIPKNSMCYFSSPVFRIPFAVAGALQSFYICTKPQNDLSFSPSEVWRKLQSLKVKNKPAFNRSCIQMSGNSISSRVFFNRCNSTIQPHYRTFTVISYWKHQGVDFEGDWNSRATLDFVGFLPLMVCLHRSFFITCLFFGITVKSLHLGACFLCC